MEAIQTVMDIPLGHRCKSSNKIVVDYLRPLKEGGLWPLSISSHQKRGISTILKQKIDVPMRPCSAHFRCSFCLSNYSLQQDLRHLKKTFSSREISLCLDCMSAEEGAASGKRTRRFKHVLWEIADESTEQKY